MATIATKTQQTEAYSGNMMDLNLKKLSEQVIVITGASSGIGLATARMAAEKGAKVVAAARGTEALRQLVDELKSQGHQAAWVEADVGKEEDVNRIAETAIREFGRFDTWVNNAAVTIFGEAMDVTIEDMRQMFETNFWSVVYGSRAAVKHFKQRGVPGALINVGSYFGNRGVVLQSTYSSTKFALHGWTESLRMELEKAKIPVAVTLIHPGRVDTPYNEHAVSYLEKQPSHVGMVYKPEAVADAILYAAAHPKRDMYVGFQSKFFTLMGQLAPRFTDKFMESTMYRTQTADRPSQPKDDNALYQAGSGMKERGSNIGWKRNRSIYVQLTKRPILSLAVAGVGVAALMMARSNKQPTEEFGANPYPYKPVDTGMDTNRYPDTFRETGYQPQAYQTSTYQPETYQPSTYQPPTPSPVSNPAPDQEESVIISRAAVDHPHNEFAIDLTDTLVPPETAVIDANSAIMPEESMDTRRDRPDLSDPNDRMVIR